MEEQKNKHGGARKGAGAPTKAEQLKSNTIFITAIKQVNNIETDDEARIHFAKDLLTFERGKMFIAEHLYGKAPQEITQTNLNLEVKELDEDEIKRIKYVLEQKY